MKKTLAILLMGLAACAADKDPTGFKSVEDYEAEDRHGGTQYQGDSLTELYPPELMVDGSYNRGICGSTTDGVIDRLWLVEKEQPETIYLMIGINNLRHGQSPDSVLDGINEILLQIAIISPDTCVHVLGLLPSSRVSMRTVEALNFRIEVLALAHNIVCEFIPTFDLFFDGWDIVHTKDGTHPTYNGYVLLLDRISKTKHL